MAQARKDPRTGQVVLYDDNGKPLGGTTGEVPFSERSIADISLEEAMQQNVPQPKAPSTGASLQGLAKDYALNKAKSYALDKGASLFASQAPAALSTSGLGPTVGASTGVGYGAPTIGSGITGIPGLDTIAPNAASEAGSAAANTTGGAGSALGNVASALAIAKGGYDSYKGWEQGGKGVRSGLTTAGAGVGSLIGGPLGAGAGAAIGNTIGYGLQGSGWKNDAALLLATGGISLPLVVARRMGVDLMHKTTKQVQQEHSEQLSKQDPTNAQWQNYLGGMRNQVANKETPFAGKYKTFDEYKNAGLEANDLSGVYGNLKAFGPDWSKLNSAQQAKITQGVIDAGLYSSKKGEVVISDEEKAKQIRDTISSSEGFDKLAAAQVKPTTGTGNSGPRKPKKVEKKEKQVPLLKSLMPDGMMAPNYETNPTQLFSNPYYK